MKKKLLLLLVLLLNGMHFANSQTFDWARRVGNLNNDHATSTVTDAAGNIYVTGTFSGTVDFDPDPSPIAVEILTAAGGVDGFIMKLDSAGDFIWASAFGSGGSNDDEAISIDIDDMGNSYITGHFFGTIVFNPGGNSIYLTANGDADVFVVKYDNTGSAVWARRAGGSGTDVGKAISVGGNGNVLVTGKFESTVDFDPSSLMLLNLSSQGLSDAFVWKLDNQGVLVWASRIGGPENDVGKSIVVRNSGFVYTVGYFGGTVDFDPGNTDTLLTSEGASDIFVQKLNSLGELVWARAMGGLLTDECFDIGTDSSSNVYLSGRFNSAPADFDPSQFGTFLLSSVGSYDGFIEKLNADGNFLWAKSVGGTGSDVISSIKVHTSSNIFLAGEYSGVADIDPDPSVNFPVTAVGGKDIFIDKTNIDGVFQSGFSIGGGGGDVSGEITVDAYGAVVVAGDFSQTAEFDPFPTQPNSQLNAAGNTDVFVVRYNTFTVGLPGAPVGSSISVFPNPVNDNFTLEWSSAIDPVTAVEVFDLSGRMLVKNIITRNEGVNTFRMDVSGLSSGLYFVNVVAGINQTTFRLVVE